MEKMSPQSQRSPSTIPLARDPEGNPIEMPDSAVCWRIRRQTGGRPRQLLDGKKQPMSFPLDYTVADVEDILAPGSYLFDAFDKNGELVGVTIALSVGLPRNAESVEVDGDNITPTVVPTTLPSTTNEVRLVLEANVRSTQMAFLHTQRMMEIGMRMAETLRDGVQVLASSQADCIKSISSARGFFRNAAQPLPPVEVKQLTVQTGGDEEDEVDDDDRDATATEAAAAPPHWSQQLMPLVTTLAQQVAPVIMAWAAKQATGNGAAKESSDKKSDDDDRPRWEARDLVDWNYAYQKTAAHREKKAAEKQAAEEAAQQAAEVEHAAKLRAAIAAASLPGPGIDVMRLMQLLPPHTLAKLTRIHAALSADEQSDAMQVLQRLDPSTLEDLLVAFDGGAVERSAAALRGLVAEWRAANAPRHASPMRPPPGGSGAGGTDGNGSTEPR